MINCILLALLAWLVQLTAAEPPPELSPALHASDDLARDLAERLRVDDPRLQAWAAYEVALHRVEGAREALLPLLARVPAKTDEKGSGRYRSALDALVCLDGPAPAEVVASAATDPRFQAQALILAARKPSAHIATLLGMLEGRQTPATWLATCELLEDERPPQLAEHLLSGLTLKLAIAVYDPLHGGGRSSFTSRFGASRISFPDGFPPYALYDLTTQARSGGVVLTNGFQTVYWVRVEIANSGSAYCVEDSTVDRDAARIDLLGRMTRPWTFPDLKSVEQTMLPWQDADTFRKAALASYECIRSERQRLVDLLIEQHLLASDAAKRHPPRIDVTVDDQRENRSTPLPSLPFPSPPAATSETP